MLICDFSVMYVRDSWWSEPQIQNTFLAIHTHSISAIQCVQVCSSSTPYSNSLVFVPFSTTDISLQTIETPSIPKSTPHAYTGTSGIFRYASYARQYYGVVTRDNKSRLPSLGVGHRQSLNGFRASQQHDHALAQVVMLL